MLVALARSVQILDNASVAVDLALGDMQVAVRSTTLVPGSSLVEVTGDVSTTGYRINQGTSFLLALAYGDDGPQARALLTYSDTEDRTNPDHVGKTERCSAKAWRDVALTPDQVRDGAISTVVVGG